MKSKLVGWLVSGVFVLVVVAIAMRIAPVRGLVFGNGAAAKAA